MRLDSGIATFALLMASCAAPPAATTPTPATTTPPPPSEDESGATVAFMIDRTFGTWMNVYGKRAGTMGGSPDRDSRARVGEGGPFRINLGFRDGREFALSASFPAGSTIADIASALADGLRKKELEVDVVPEFGTFRIAFTKGLYRIEASGPDGFTFESHVGKRDEFTLDERDAIEPVSSMTEIMEPVASLRLLRFERDGDSRHGVFELRNLSRDTLHYSGTSEGSPCSFEDEEWVMSGARRMNHVTCGNGTSMFTLAPGASFEFHAVWVTDTTFQYLMNTRVGVHFDEVPGTMGRGVDVWSELITAETK